MLAGKPGLFLLFESGAFSCTFFLNVFILSIANHQQIAEVVDSMKDLMIFSMDSNIGPIGNSYCLLVLGDICRFRLTFTVTSDPSPLRAYLLNTTSGSL